MKSLEAVFSTLRMFNGFLDAITSHRPKPVWGLLWLLLLLWLFFNRVLLVFFLGAWRADVSCVQRHLSDWRVTERNKVIQPANSFTIFLYIAKLRFFFIVINHLGVIDLLFKRHFIIKSRSFDLNSIYRSQNRIRTCS